MKSTSTPSCSRSVVLGYYYTLYGNHHFLACSGSHAAGVRFMKKKTRHTTYNMYVDITTDWIIYGEDSQSYTSNVYCNRIAIFIRLFLMNTVNWCVRWNYDYFRKHSFLSISPTRFQFCIFCNHTSVFADSLIYCQKCSIIFVATN